MSQSACVCSYLPRHPTSSYLAMGTTNSVKPYRTVESEHAWVAFRLMVIANPKRTILMIRNFQIRRRRGTNGMEQRMTASEYGLRQAIPICKYRALPWSKEAQAFNKSQGSLKTGCENSRPCPIQLVSGPLSTSRKAGRTPSTSPLWAIRLPHMPNLSVC